MTHLLFLEREKASRIAFIAKCTLSYSEALGTYCAQLATTTYRTDLQPEDTFRINIMPKVADTPAQAQPKGKAEAPTVVTRSRSRSAGAGAPAATRKKKRTTSRENGVNLIFSPDNGSSNYANDEG
eukprot:scaffold11583_cov73-Skeletonema_marinoi.AAC.1